MQTSDQLIRDIVNQERGASAMQLLEKVNRALVAAGHDQIRAVEELDHQTRINPECTNPGNLEGRTQYRVNHGDGTYSDPWWSDWRCL